MTERAPQGGPAARRGQPALRRCVAVEPDRFAAEVWSRAPLLSRREDLGTDGFADLLSLEAADELLSRRGLRTPFLRVAKDGAVVASGRYTGSGGTGAGVADQVADDRVLELFADGHTVVLQGLHRLWPPLIDFAGELAGELGHPVQINAYVTPTQSQGFAAHYDTHDVFVLQVAGEKRWRIHEPVLRHPLPDQPWTDVRDAVKRKAEDEPVIDTVLRPGDALYLPRGYLHSAEALGGVTCHLTVGVHPVTRHTLVEALLRYAVDEPQLRTSLGVGVDLTDPAAFAADFDATVALLTERLRAVSPADVADSVATRVVTGNRPAPLGPLEQAAALAALGPSSTVVARRHLRSQLVVDDQVRLRTFDRTITLPLATAKSLRTLLDGEPVQVSELPDLEPVDAVALVRRLVREGVLVVLADGAPDVPPAAG